MYIKYFLLGWIKPNHMQKEEIFKTMHSLIDGKTQFFEQRSTG